ncbi:MAG: Ppx/GppA phosphatase family protein [Burkholderiaceae bacterium]
MLASSSSSKPAPLLAAVDLGSNSFRLLIGRVDRTELGEQIRPVDSLKETVRLAGGLGPDGRLDIESQRRGLDALARFGERLRSFAPSTVRAIATNTLRIATNAGDFIGSAEAALGFPIEVIPGREEARLIYLGAAHALPLDSAYRLVIDIGGGSTECIVGKNYEAKLTESAVVGCVGVTARFFPDGRITREGIQHARFAASDEFAPYALAYRRHGWAYAVGTSGTAKALMQLGQEITGEEHLTRQVLERLVEEAVRAGHVNKLKLDALRIERRPVLPGGLAVMLAAFDEFGIDSMRYCNSALRQGALYDLLGRTSGHDMRAITVSQMSVRYGVDRLQAHRVARTAVALFDQLQQPAAEEASASHKLIDWAAQLAEVGMSISHTGYHKHSAYILSNADMPGFSQGEKNILANLVLGHTGGLRKLRGRLRTPTDWLMVLCLRIASIVHRHRDDEEMPVPRMKYRSDTRVTIEVERDWRARHPLTDETLRIEAGTWSESGPFKQVQYRTQARR